ncbi:hypothetical protein ElyMa_006205300 [Elysia marginata]|uniref:Uncharacterized protein n=1 Tax=Elysia marginata TaxID=1093978 RepID=A0AAV4H534_9GAST|nr:hypothetical protein ElyMa_006205300 [Elysia marginata]
MLNESGTTRKPLVLSQRRKLKCAGHANRNDRTDLVSTVLQGEVGEKRSSGLLPASLTTNITNISGKKPQALVKLSQDRECSRQLVRTSRQTEPGSRVLETVCEDIMSD